MPGFPRLKLARGRQRAETLKSTETTVRIGVKVRPAETEKVFRDKGPPNSGTSVHLHWNCMIPTLTWTPEGVRFIDQTRLPLEESYVLATTYEAVAEVIVTMVVRGAPAIGVSAAYGIALGAKHTKARTAAEFAPEFERICARLAGTRPTAVNLFWAIDRMKGLFANLLDSGASLGQVQDRILAEAHAMYDEDIAACKAMGAFGGALMPEEGGVLTHCNAGALATCGYGTALGVIRSAVEQGKNIHVFADETRPFLQGARLTAWELMADGIPTTVICDNMAAPWSTIDLATKTGDAIPIEERPQIEVTHHGGKQLTPNGVGICNPAFDVTPAKYITGIITERGVLRAPYHESLKQMELVAG